MQEIRRRHHHSHARPAQQGAGAWLALIFGALAAFGVWQASASMAWVVVFLLIGAAPFFWRALQRLQIDQRALSEVQASGAQAEFSSDPGYWADWLNGWYWQTDEQHRLVLLKPDREDSQAWIQAQRWTNIPGAWWVNWRSSWSDPDDAGLARLAMLETRMKARLALDLDGLPWPDAAAGPQASVPPVHCCTVKGVPRHSAQGQWLGYHGILRFQGPQAAPADTASASMDGPGNAPGASVGADPAVKEAEQEMLRYALSHDLRAPLRVVDGFARILKEDYSKALDKLGNDHLDRVLAASSRMNGMIDAILAQAQLSQAPLHRERVELSALAGEVATELVAARHSHIESDGCFSDVQVVVEPGLVTQADPAMVRRVLDNLIGNALKYSSKVPQPRIEVGRVAATDPEVYFVRDNGAGFDMQHAEKLFGLFQRLHSAKEFPGSGVGLAGVQNIIRRHGGRVWAEAAPGDGACFYFTLQPSVAASLQGSVHRA
jgi:signal transduction histidine kinase